MLTKLDLLQLKEKNIDQELIQRQLDRFKQGFPFIRLDRPAIIGDGIIAFSSEELNHYKDYFDYQAGKCSVLKFVPASGAATRMFKHLYEFLTAAKQDEEGSVKFLQDQGFNSVSYFISNLRKFAFFHPLNSCLHKDGLKLEQLLSEKKFSTVIDYVLSERGLNYANLPKALLAFHNYPDCYRVAAEEHLVEAAYYATDEHRNSSVHFTISPEHIDRFDERIRVVKEKYELLYKVRFRISHSIQKSSTDTLAVDEQNQPFRNPDGSLLFRPAGHGALLDNLYDTDAEIIFIKNIDNVVPDRLKTTTFENKKLIGGLLLELRDLIFSFLRKADSGDVSNEEMNRIADFASTRLNISFPADFQQSSPEVKMQVLVRKLNRPIRVCGMVKNSGEPGGGPFWVQNPDGDVSLQIVESSQMNLKDQDQMKIFSESTHFNPVDLVCCIRDFKGNPFKLHDFVDESTGFISMKSSGGKNLKAMELPGLWNGSMSDWITVFVEVPLLTFNPVKTVNDLLRNEHQ